LIVASTLSVMLAKPLNILSLDVARRYHSPSTLRYLIRCCEAAKVPYIQLHLTDDQNWMFPSRLLEGVKKFNQNGKPPYSLTELHELQQFAHKRGVGLIPEIDLPGHSSILVRMDPAKFGINGRGNCINFASPSVRKFSRQLVKEVAEVFSASPYIHIGGDEANYGELESDPSFSQQKAARSSSWTPAQSFVEFVGSLAEDVLKLNKTPLMWEGFSASAFAKARIPRKAIVVAWEGDYYPAEQLVKDGYNVINAGWDPFYVVNHYPYDSFTLAPLPSLYAADNLKFGTFRAAKVPLNRSVGSMMCWWEGWQWNAQRYLPLRILALGSGGGKQDYAAFLKRGLAAVAALDKEAFPFGVTTMGQCELAPDCFTKSLRVEVSPRDPRLEIAIRTDGEVPTVSDMRKSVTLEQTAVVSIQAYRQGRPVGETLYRQFSKVSEVRNLAWGARASANTPEDPQFPLSALTDGVADKVGSFWLGYPNPSVITLDLASAKLASRVEVVPFWASGDRTNYRVSVYSSPNGWEQVGDASKNSTPPTASGDRFEFSARKVARVRVEVLGSTQYPSSIARIHEIRLF
jgi:hexosaminidase